MLKHVGEKGGKLGGTDYLTYIVWANINKHYQILTLKTHIACLYMYVIREKCKLS